MNDEAPKPESELPAGTGPSGEAPEAEKASGRKALVWLLLIAAALAFAGWLQLSGRLDRWFQHPEVSRPAPEAPPKPAPVVRPEPAPAPRPAPRPSAAPKPPLSSSEARALMQAMDDLSEQLQRQREQTEALARSLAEVERMNLDVRLRWILDPASRLAQMRLAWEEISLLPGLKEDEREQARKLTGEAAEALEQIRAWRAELAQWAEALTTPVHADILPRPEHPWLAWIVGQFHLRPAPGKEERELARLKTALLDVERDLAIERFPDARRWRRLRAELLLRLEAMAREGRIAEARLGLPDDFEEMKARIRAIREAAAAWRSARES